MQDHLIISQKDITCTLGYYSKPILHFSKEHLEILLHLLIDCKVITRLWNKPVGWLAYYSALDFTLGLNVC